MKKTTLFTLACLALGLNMTAANITLPYSQDFSKITDGSSIDSNKQGTLVDLTKTALEGISAVTNVYNAGTMIKLGTSSKTGTFTTELVETAEASKIKISFDAASWVASSAKNTDVVISYGTQTQTVTVASTLTAWPTEGLLPLNSYSATFKVEDKATAITFTANKGATSGDLRSFIDNLKIEASNAVVVETPVITPDADVEYKNDINVEITCATDGASIYYTLDGTVPAKDNGTLYTGAIAVTKTTTLKAIAIKEGAEDSAIATATYTLAKAINAANIAEVLADASETNEYVITGSVSVVYQNGDNLYIKDNSAWTLCYGSTENIYENGDVLTGIKCVYSKYNNIPQITFIELPAATKGTAVSALDVNCADITVADAHKLVKISDMEVANDFTYTTSKAANASFVNGETTMTVRNNYLNLAGSYKKGDHYDITAIVAVYSSKVQLYPISLEKSGQAENVVKTPTFTPADDTEYTSAINVEIACETEGASIYYTVNGDVPSKENGTLYTEAIAVSETTTIKAVAVKEGLTDSNIASATYTILKYNKVANIAALLADASTTKEYEITGAVTVVYQNGTNLYLTDESASVLCFGTAGKTYQNGDVLSGIVCKYALYGGTCQLTPVTMPDAVKGTEVEPTEMNMSEISATDVHKFIKISKAEVAKDFTFTTTKAGNGTFVNGESTMTVRNNFKNLAGTYKAGEEYNFIGFVSVYNNALQLYPIALELITGVESALNNKVTVAGGNGSISVLGQAKDIKVYNINGTLVSSNAAQVECATGLYIVVVDGKASKVVVR